MRTAGANFCQIEDRLIVGLVFPQHEVDKTDFTGLQEPILNTNIEPSLLAVLPPGDNVRYAHRHEELADISDEDVELYLCSVYITGFRQFMEFAETVDSDKIVVGGVQPTMTPEWFDGLCWKIVRGLCDDAYATIGQDGDVVQGVVSYENLPRYDLYDVRYNSQIIPDRMHDETCSSINTSVGCVHNCEFCCTPVMYGRRIYKKPIEFLEREARLLVELNGTFDNVFIRDENFLMLPDHVRRIETLNRVGLARRYHCFASADQVLRCDLPRLVENGLVLVNMDYGDPFKTYLKNDRIAKACQLLRRHGILVQMSYIIDPTQVLDRRNEDHAYDILEKMTRSCHPAMLSGNFLMPFPGTPIFERYEIIDYDNYILKSPRLLVKDLEVCERMEQKMFWFQQEYLESDFYNLEIRSFRNDPPDVLELKFDVLRRIFTDAAVKSTFNGITFKSTTPPYRRLRRL